MYDEEVDAEYSFNICLEHNAQSVEEYVDIVYTNLVETIEEEYNDAEIVRPEPEIIDHFFNEETTGFPN